MQSTPQGDLLLAYMESPDIGRALSLFAESRDEFDVWFKRRMQEATGLDLNTPPPGPHTGRWVPRCPSMPRCQA